MYIHHFCRLFIILEPVVHINLNLYVKSCLRKDNKLPLKISTLKLRIQIREF